MRLIDASTVEGAVFCSIRSRQMSKVNSRRPFAVPSAGQEEIVPLVRDFSFLAMFRRTSGPLT